MMQPDAASEDSGSEHSELDTSPTSCWGPRRPLGVIDVPMPEGKPDLTHYILPPTRHYFTSRRGDRQHVRSWTPPATAVVGSILYLHGYAGHVNSPGASEFFCRFRDSGFAVFTFDFQGHGYSPGERCLIRDFDHLLDDVVDFVGLLFGDGPAAGPGFRLGVNAEFLGAIRTRKHFVYGESMGGALALFAAQRLSTEELEVDSELGGAVVVAPALNVDLPPVAVQVFLRNFVAPVLPSSPMPAMISKNSNLDMAAIVKDEEQAALRQKDDWGEAKGGLGWKKAMKWGTAAAFSMLYSKLDETIEEMDFPILVLHDPEDSICGYAGSRKLMELSPSDDKQLIDVPNGLHDISSNEPDLVIAKAVEFFRGRL